MRSSDLEDEVFCDNKAQTAMKQKLFRISNPLLLEHDFDSTSQSVPRSQNAKKPPLPRRPKPIVPLEKLRSLSPEPEPSTLTRNLPELRRNYFSQQNWEKEGSKINRSVSVADNWQEIKFRRGQNTKKIRRPSKKSCQTVEPRKWTEYSPDMKKKLFEKPPPLPKKPLRFQKLQIERLLAGKLNPPPSRSINRRKYHLNSLLSKINQDLGIETSEDETYDQPKRLKPDF